MNEVNYRKNLQRCKNFNDKFFLAYLAYKKVPRLESAIVQPSYQFIPTSHS